MKVEEDSRLSMDTITYLKYIKPPHLHMSSQKVAHIVFSFNSQWGANNAIEAGMFIKGKHSNVHKMLMELQRCLKCQRCGHYVPDCKVTTDICTQYSKQHRTSQCNITEMVPSDVLTAKIQVPRDMEQQIEAAQLSMQKKTKYGNMSQKISISSS
jgi:hypothetical protein